MTPLRIARRVGWGVADQGISSLANFVLGIVVARELGAADFGAYALAFATFSFVISAARGPSTDPLMVRHSGPRSATWHLAVSAASGTSVAFGAVAGAVCVALGLALPSDVGLAFVGVGIWMPGILLQDSYRFAFFSCGQAHRAFLNDLAWGVIQVAAVLFLVSRDLLSPFSALFVFGFTATLAGGLGWWQSRIAPDPRRFRTWLVENKALGGRYLVENVTLGGARQLRLTAVGLVAGLSAVGDIRAAEMLVGPFMILLSGVSQVSVPEARQVLAMRPRALPRFCALLAAVQATLVAVWGVVALVVLPMGLGHLVLGPLWKPAAPLLVPTLLTLMLVCVQNSWQAGVRALGASRRSLSAQLTSGALVLVFGIGGAYLDGARGSCWGLVTATSLGLLMWFWQLRTAVHEHLAVPSADRLVANPVGGAA
jgi:O-antigen/teichoic acid export membrane protein